ncbi:AMP-binding protein [Ensifer soli]|uniref:AMP-binding protein n=1 Tax=Ciceribacter sp. sgz301302 TaxID=3342379 RepID=UPI0035B8A9F7
MNRSDFSFPQTLVAPSRAHSVLCAMLDRQATAIGDKTLMVFDDGESWTYARTQAEARATAAGLAGLGVSKGDTVLVWLPNGPLIFKLHLALGYLGAIFVPINLALRGGVLQHIVTNSAAKLIVCHQDLLERLTTIALGALTTVVHVGGEGDDRLGLAQLPETVLTGLAADLVDAEAKPSDIQGIFYTSGTTGPSKGVICPSLHTSVMARVALRFLGPDDRFLINMPYFHLGGALVPFAVIERGASMAMLTRFRTPTFWDDVRRTGSTACYILDSIRTFLMKQPPTPRDADNPLRFVVQQPLSHDSAEFSARFDVTIFTQWDMTEVLPVILSGPVSRTSNLQKGYCGEAAVFSPACEIRLVDADDFEVPDGELGELVVRCDQPWVLSPGYWQMPEATAKVWRNGWFHTGDIFRRNAEGSYFYIDRIKDAIRRRGENISSSEVEAEALAHDDIELAAAVAVPSEHSEDEVLLVLQPKQGRSVDPRACFDFLVPRLPHYMLPRFIRIVREMQMTETIKIRKNVLRDEGVTAETWDREAEGIVVKAARIGEGAPRIKTHDRTESDRS